MQACVIAGAQWWPVIQVVVPPSRVERGAGADLAGLSVAPYWSPASIFQVIFGRISSLYGLMGLMSSVPDQSIDIYRVNLQVTDDCSQEP
jgi:hypothetical protein